jgi:protein Mpv17
MRSIDTILCKYPVLSNASAGFSYFAIGDMAAQKFLDPSSSELNMTRTLNVGALGVLTNGFLLPKWYNKLDFVFGPSMISKKVIVLKMLADQLVYSPFAITMFFGFNCLHSSTKTELYVNFVSKMKSSFLSTYFADWSVWPMVNFVVFRYIPLQFRPLFIGEFCCFNC